MQNSGRGLEGGENRHVLGYGRRESERQIVVALDLALRGGACAILGLMVALLLRDGRRRRTTRLSVLFAVGAAAFAVKTTPGFPAALFPWGLALTLISSGNSVVFWLLARQVFDDRFQPAARHAALWLAILVVQLVNQLGFVRHTALAPNVWALLVFQGPIFAVLAAAQTITTWGEDLVDRRRRLRVVVVAACAIYIVLSIGPDLSETARASEVSSILGAAGLLSLVMVSAWRLLAASPPGARSIGSGVKGGVIPQADLSAADHAVLARLETVMSVERAYRQDGLTVAALAARLDLPEYRLRRLINQGLGHRNFSSYVNGWRIRDATSALSDPGEAETSILTIALDAGFASLGPFNRAFKAETGLTPSDFRSQRGGARPQSC